MGEEGRRACLLLHGFTGGPYELMPLAGALQEKNWQCRVPELPGHDPELAGLGNAGCEDWLEASYREAEELVRLYGSFDLVGFSMGGMLAVHLAARYPVRRLALLGAAAIYVSPGRLVRELMSGKSGNDPHARHKVRQTPASAVLEFIRLVHKCRRDLRNVRAPALILQGLQDPVVHPASAKYLSRRLPQDNEVMYFPRSKHLLCLGCESQEVIGAVTEFLSN